MFKSIALTAEEEQLKKKFAQAHKIRQDSKPDQRDQKMKLTLKGSSKGSSNRVDSIAAAKAVLNADRQQNELKKKEFGFKRSNFKPNPISNFSQNDNNNSFDKKRNFDEDNRNNNTNNNIEFQESKRVKTGDDYYGSRENETRDNNYSNNSQNEDNVICLTELPDNCTEENVRRRFEKFGPIKLFLPYFQNTTEKYALIHYYSSNIADTAVAEFEKDPIFEGKEIQVYKPSLDEEGDY